MERTVEKSKRMAQRIVERTDNISGDCSRPSFSVSIKNIHCSTATITINGEDYLVCYWFDNNEKSPIYSDIQWVEHLKTKKVYYKPYAEISNITPVMKAICDLYKNHFSLPLL
jgi:hypothetical protein